MKYGGSKNHGNDKSRAHSAGKNQNGRQRELAPNPYSDAPKKKSAQKQKDPLLSEFIQAPPSTRTKKTESARQSSRTRKIQNNALRHRTKHKKNYTLHYITLFIIMLTTAVALSLTVFFNVGEFVVSGEMTIDKNEIISVSKVNIGDNMLRMNVKSIEEKITKKYVTVETVDVTRRFPATLSIKIVMSKPKATIQYENKFYTLSEGNRIIDINTVPMDKKLIHFVGISLKDAKLGDYLTDEKVYDITSIDAVNTSVKDSKIKGITTAYIKDSMAISLYVGEQYEIKVGGISDLTYKLHCSSTIIDKELTDKTLKGIIDASVNTGAYYFRPTDKIEIPTK